jgi:hypothetical protein
MKEARAGFDVRYIGISTKPEQELGDLDIATSAAEEKRRIPFAIGEVDRPRTSARGQQKFNDRKTVVGTSYQQR